MKRRRNLSFKKQWIGKKANQKSLKRYCYEIWSELIRCRDDHCCFYCKSKQNLTAHHLITKKWNKTCFNINNGVTLCKECHTTNVTSAHLSPWILEEKLKLHKKEQYDWFIENRKLISNFNKDNIDYKKELDKLMLEFEKIKPVEYKRSGYFKFSELEEKEIINDFISSNNTCVDVAKKWKCSNHSINEILCRNGISKELIQQRKIENTKKQCGLSVSNLDKDGKIINTFPSISEAARILNIKVTSIHNCLVGLSKSCAGYRWIRG